jgi:hypothetical protein
VNHKQYYYIAVAYAHNEFWPYSQEPGVPDGLLGQKKPYLAGRKSATGRIQSITAIPHNTTPTNGGSVINAQYGDGRESRVLKAMVTVVLNWKCYRKASTR